jgi:hypothetical protein
MSWKAFIMRRRALPLPYVALTCWLAVGCSSGGSDPGGTAQAGATVGGGAGSNHQSGAGGESGAVGRGGSGGTSGSPSAGGDNETSGSGGTAGAPTLADADAAIQMACTTALKECPQLDVAKCKAQSTASLPAPNAHCFAERIHLVECIGELPPSAFQCVGDQASASQQLCPAENNSLQACYAGP